MSTRKSDHKHLYQEYLQLTGCGWWHIVKVCSICGKIRPGKMPTKKLPNGCYLWLNNLEDIQAEYPDIPILER